ncbi:uncharacterized protein LOC129780160 [Toxorhynchites rutilus septentrionalis]|uniref:uncharacterized protein LOC129780160 n=1 Tax=Toxorhynchites rutilus septentrionalis TaxID=329112 RepID=UPI0024784E98|nr:uncharacterized protein LOC129780160 [Toxorhynchites rutilus septentrionalis]
MENLEASSPSRSTGFKPIDILDEQFAHYLELARQLLPKIKTHADRQICSKYITRCCRMSNTTHTAKSYRNEFFRYFLKVVEATIANQLHYVEMDSELEPMKDEVKQIYRWSDDRKRYVAAKIIPNYATIVYMAVCDDPEQGWDNGGFGCYEF